MDRAERRHRTACVVARRIKVMRWSNMEGCMTERYIGRCKKVHPLDCGCPKCGVCSLNKRKWAGPTVQERKADSDSRGN